MKSIFLFLIVCLLTPNLCFAGDDVSAKVTEDAINKRISEIRKGKIVVKTNPGAEVEVKKLKHEFLFGTAITNNLA